MKYLYCVFVFVLFSYSVFGQEKKIMEEVITENDSLKQVLKNLKEKELLFQKELDIKADLLKEIKGKDSKKELKSLISNITDTIQKLKIEHYKTRTLFSHSNSLYIRPFPVNPTYSIEIERLIEQLKYLKKKKLDGNLEEVNIDLIASKEERLDQLRVYNNREILEAYVLAEAEGKSVLSSIDIDGISVETKNRLDHNRSVVLDKYAQYVQIEDSKNAFTNSKIEYRATIINTHFTIPIVRFNQVKNNKDKEGDIQLFNSLGAGVSYSAGRITDIRDGNGEIIDTEFNNSWGFSLGVIFSAGSANGEERNVFAPMASFNLLDFQLGYGVELGTRVENQKRGFFTVAYAIPLYKLTKAKFRILRKGTLINDVIEN